MKNPQDDAEEAEDLPVINIDDDPENANWLRILAQRREEQAQKDDEDDGR